MAPQRLGLKYGQQAGNNLSDILRLEPDIDDRRRRRSTLSEDEFAKIPVAGDQDPMLPTSALEYRFIVVELICKRRLRHVMAFRKERACKLAADVRVAEEPHAARARPL